MNLPNNVIIEFPTGRFGFVGRVDSRLMFDTDDRAILKELCEANYPAMVMKKHGVKRRTFETEYEAIQAAQELGY